MRADGASRRYKVDPFFQRIESAIAGWLENEWMRKETIRQKATVLGWNAKLKTAYSEASLTPFTLAHHIDHISVSKLRRELEKIGAPSPGKLIRDGRIAFAKQLLTHGRLLIREVGERAGYENEKHFGEVFSKATGMKPSEFRRSAIANFRERTPC